MFIDSLSKYSSWSSTKGDAWLIRYDEINIVHNLISIAFKDKVISKVTTLEQYRMCRDDNNIDIIMLTYLSSSEMESIIKEGLSKLTIFLIYYTMKPSNNRIIYMTTMCFTIKDGVLRIEKNRFDNYNKPILIKNELRDYKISQVIEEASIDHHDI